MRSNKQITLLIAMLVLAVLMSYPMTGCGDSDSPADVVDQSFKAYNDRDFNKVYDLSSSNLQNVSESREKVTELMEASWPPGAKIVNFEITEEKIDGDHAVVTWRGTLTLSDNPDQQAGATVNLVKEDGVWKIDL